MIVVHCSATRCNRPYTLEQLEHDHVVVNGWRYIGYHYYITRDGTIHACRPEERMGAHARGYNAHSIGICYEGGLDEHGRCKDTRTLAQKVTMEELLQSLCVDYPDAEILGHRDLPGVHKECPCFDTRAWLKEINFHI